MARLRWMTGNGICQNYCQTPGAALADQKPPRQKKWLLPPLQMFEHDVGIVPRISEGASRPVGAIKANRSRRRMMVHDGSRLINDSPARAFRLQTKIKPIHRCVIEV